MYIENVYGKGSYVIEVKDTFQWHGLPVCRLQNICDNGCRKHSDTQLITEQNVLCVGKEDREKNIFSFI